MKTLAAEFQAIPSEAKPKVRFWVPDAAMEKDELIRDIQDIAALGFGGIEVVGNSARTRGLTEDELWGTPKWDEMMTVIVDTARKLGLSVDVTNGPGWPISMPAIQSADDEAASYEMTYGAATLPAGSVYSGSVPQPNTVRKEGTPRLFAVSAYRRAGEKVLDINTCTNLMPAVAIGENADDSLLNWTAPTDGGDWEILAFYEQPTAQKTGNFFVPGGLFYVVDHFGKAGTQACIDYWEQAMREKDYMQYIECLFNDSLEYEVDKEWTRGFLSIFHEQKGYELLPYLPAVGGPGYFGTGEGPNYTFTDGELSLRVQNDYNETITWCYTEHHLKPLQQMAERHGMTIRYQVAYNKPLEISASALAVGIPECEPYGLPTLDNLRRMASAVHMGGKKILSCETTAEFGNAYGQSYADIAWWIKRGWAAGVNHQVLHGASYSGKWDGGKLEGVFTGEQYMLSHNWPGWSGFSGRIANDWNRNTSVEQAASYMAYISRCNYVMQKVSKIDIAVFRNTYNNLSETDGGDGEDWYPDGGILNSYGYSYEFISTAMLSLDNAMVSNGVLNESGPAYKAVVIHHQACMSIGAANKLVRLGAAGLRIVIVGPAPSKLMYQEEKIRGGADADIQVRMEQLLAMDNVAQVEAYSEVPVALKSLDVLPDAHYHKPVDVLARHQADETGDFYYFYNYNKVGQEAVHVNLITDGTGYPGIDKNRLSSKEFTVSLVGNGKPYLMNAWDGTITPMAEYTVEGSKVTLRLDLSRDEAVLVALLTDEAATANGLVVEKLHVSLNTGKNLIGYGQNGLTLKLTTEQSHPITLSDGSTAAFAAYDLQPPFSVDSWKLEINRVSQGETIFFRDSTWEMTEPVIITRLKGWKDLCREWETASGIGIYTAEITLQNGWKEGYGAYIDLGEVEDTFTVTVNGTPLESINQVNTIIDIGPFARKGQNTLRVEVASTLLNQYGAYYSAANSPVVNGLLGADGVVTVTPYKQIVIYPE